MNNSKPKRITLSRKQGFDLQSHSKALNGLDAVNVARPGKWGNPFVVGEDGTKAYCVDLYVKLMAGFLCMSSKATIAAQNEAHMQVASHLSELRGKNLACWCKSSPCHADILLKMANL